MPKFYIQNWFLSELLLHLFPLLGVKPNWLLVFKVSYVYIISILSVYKPQCYVRQCWPICTILLELSRGMKSCMLLFILGSLWYTMLVFRSSSLHTLRQYEGIMWLTDTITNCYYFSIFQYHNNNTTNINNISVHLTGIVSLRVPLLPLWFI